MGISDKIEIPAHKNVIQEFVGNKKDVDIKKIAFLGSKKEMLTNRHPDSVENFVSEFFETNEIDLFDIEDGTWDVNSSWENVNNYDLVICFRTTMYAKSIDQFFGELKRLIEINQRVLFDFSIYSGNIIHDGKRFRALGSRNPRVTSLGALSFDFRNDLTLGQKIKASFRLKVGRRYFLGEMVNSFNRRRFLDEGIEPKRVKYHVNPIKRDLVAYLYWHR